MRALPVLEGSREALETCVFCPKLCRTACPVSNAEPRETLTPWGKMSAAWMAAQGDVPLDRGHAAPAWACTGCYACREACEPRNDVAGSLLRARDAFWTAGVAPEAAERVLASFTEREADARHAARSLASQPGVDGGAAVALLIGCTYLRLAPQEARAAVSAAVAVLGEPVAIVESCCGLPLRLAASANAFGKHAQRVAASLKKHKRAVVVDAGCALALERHYEACGVRLSPRVETLVEVAARSPSWMARAIPVKETRAPVRWHDPCQLGRGLGLYDEPRMVLGRALGRPPDELLDCRERAPCSGAGGLLPLTMPRVAGEIASERLRAHERSGGGHVVTACASSLVALRKKAQGTSVIVDDLVSWIARASPSSTRYAD
jgi:dimethylglycine catabolism B